MARTCDRVPVTGSVKGARQSGAERVGAADREPHGRVDHREPVARAEVGAAAEPEEAVGRTQQEHGEHDERPARTLGRSDQRAVTEVS